MHSPRATDAKAVNNALDSRPFQPTSRIIYRIVWRR